MHRILIVEDDDAMRELIRARLEDTYEITDTGDPERVLAMALEHKPNAILLDLSLPKLSGFELCQTLSSLSFTQQIPIFVVSGKPAAEYKDFCQNLGASGYFEKPIDFEQLKTRLAAAVRSKRPERRAELRIRSNVALKLRGTDKHGTPFEVPTATENVSASGFLCGCAAPLAKDAIVEVSLCAGVERHVGRARSVRAEWMDTSHPRYGFRFVEKPAEWILAISRSPIIKESRPASNLHPSAWGPGTEKEPRFSLPSAVSAAKALKQAVYDFYRKRIKSPKLGRL